MTIVDTHAHLNHEDLLPQAAEIVERAKAAGVDHIVVVGYDVPSSAAAVELAHRLDGLVAAVGLHPYEAVRSGEEEIAQIAKLAKDPMVRAIGEIGLDFHGDEPAPPKRQDWLVRRQFEVARTAGLPVVLHLRDSGLRIVEVLDDFPDMTTVFHCFSGDAALLQAGLARGAYISFAGPLTFKKNDELRLLAAQVPAERLLVETDSPYLAPVPFRGKPNEPAYVRETLAALAAARGAAPESLAEITSSNARSLFRLF
ncbi:MAG: TatD family hydrolase [Thermaerobacter sp.]|nr:TatD family hydrolase [Thermaerobacter sp.]